MRTLASAAVAALCLLGIGAGEAGGSLTVSGGAPTFGVEIILEQEVSTVDSPVGDWRVFAGSGVGVTPNDGLSRLDPFVLACNEVDVFLAFSELCLEGRVPVVGGDSDWVRFTWTTVW